MKLLAKNISVKINHVGTNRILKLDFKIKTMFQRYTGGEGVDEGVDEGRQNPDDAQIARE
jgi:hypothetical protein